MKLPPVPGLVVAGSLLLYLGAGAPRTFGGDCGGGGGGVCGGLAEAAGPAVKPRWLWERVRTRMIFQSKGRLGLRPSQGAGSGVLVVPDVPYGPHPGQRLDLYLPPVGPFPVVVFVHGGAWVSEDKDFFGMVGRYLAGNGVGAVLVNYRLPPDAGCAGELQDVAAAFAWSRRSAADFGGDPDRLFLCGHSAGGHLVAVLATNPAYLAAHGLTPAAVRGVIAFSGIYRIGPNIRVLGVAYAFQDVDWKAVSPVNLVHPDLPPFLLIRAQGEIAYLAQPTEEFHRRLRACGARSERYVVPGENHYGQVLHINCPGSPQGPRMLEFIRRQCSSAGDR
jgi:acetyl esterase/lipase